MDIKALTKLGILERIFVQFNDVFQMKEFFHLKITGPDHARFGFGPVTFFEAGTSYTVTLVTSPGSFAIISKALGRQGFVIHRLRG